MKIFLENNVVTAKAETLEDIAVLTALTKGRWPQATVGKEIVPPTEPMSKKSKGNHSNDTKAVLARLAETGSVDNYWFKTVQTAKAQLSNHIYLAKKQGMQFTTAHSDNGNYHYYLVK